MRVAPILPKTKGYREVLILGAFLFISGLLFSCQKKIEEAPQSFYVPFPDERMARYYQSRVDSSEFLWFIDVKSAASAFMNEEVERGNFSTDQVRILGESLFHAQVEVQMPDKILVLTMLRPFQEKGDKSIWQVIKVEEKQWPKGKSK